MERHKSRRATLLVSCIFACFAETSQADVQASDPVASPSVIDIATDVAVSLSAHGRRPVVVRSDRYVQDQLPGAENVECGPGRRSFARGRAQIDVLERSIRSLRLRMRVSTLARGGQLPDCPSCNSPGCEIGTSRETRGIAQSNATSTVIFRVPRELANRPFYLSLANARADLDVSLTDSNGTSISPQDASGRYIVRGPEGSTLKLILVLRTASEEDGAGTGDDSRTAEVVVFLEPGPLLFSYKAQPYIHGGTATSSYEQVGSVRLDGITHCTATLIASRTLLTAAHCIAGYGEAISQGRMTFATGVSATHPDRIYRISGFDYPRDVSSGFNYDPGTYTDDIGLLYLESVASLSPMSLHSSTPLWDAMRQNPIVFVGYGYNVIGGEHVGLGIKREAQWMVETVEPRVIAWRNENTSTCQGDSGGPGFVIEPNRLLLVAVTSGGNEFCTEGRNMRVDAYQPWLSGRVR